tara:strand:- start:8952 stop:9611 length:660 start_codon:yes stop_codon:yes gene_type:complete
MARVNPPRQLKLPKSVNDNPDLKKAFDDLNFIVFQLWQRTGAGDDFVKNNQIDELYSNLQAIDQEAANRELKAFYQKNNAEQNNITINPSIKEVNNFTYNVTEQGETSQNSTVNPLTLKNTFTPIFNTEETKEPLIVTQASIITTESMVVVSDGSNNITVTLNPSPNDNEQVTIKRAGSGIITLASSKGVHTLKNYTTTTIYDRIKLRFAGVKNQWIII